MKDTIKQARSPPHLFYAYKQWRNRDDMAASIGSNGHIDVKIGIAMVLLSG